MEAASRLRASLGDSSSEESPIVVLSISRAMIAIAFSLIGLSFIAAAVRGFLPRVLLIAGVISLASGVLISIKTPRGALSRALAKFALLFFSLVITLLVCEGGFRLFFRLKGWDIHQYQPSFINAYTNERQFDRRRFISHPFLPFAARPFDGRTLFIDRLNNGHPIRYDYQQNSFGLRSPERPFEKPSKTLRIITLGGSTTWDGPTNEQTWPAMLEKKLNEHYGGVGYRIETINLAADGYSSPMSLVSLALLGVQFHPDLVISYDGINDLMLEGYEGLVPDYRTVMSKFDDRFQTLQARLPSLVFKSYLLSVATRECDILRGGDPDVLHQVVSKPRRALTPSNDPLAGVEYFERNLRLMRAIANESNAKFVASTAHYVTPTPKELSQNARLRDFFREARINYLDADSLLPHDDRSLHVDQIHWTPKGLDMFSNEWLKMIIREDLLGLNSRLSSR